MDVLEKLEVLSTYSQYDISCACGTNKYDRRKRGCDGKWLYPVPLPNGGYSILLKTLLSNACVNDCKYCPIRVDSNIKRCTLQPEEIAKVFMEYFHKKKAFGLFLSSGVVGSPDNSMEKIIATARILRQKYGYPGYIHLKILPGVSEAAIEEAISLANSVSLNIETPGEKRFQILSKKKDYLKDIIKPLTLVAKLIQKSCEAKRINFTTQFVVGASDEIDSEIVDYTFKLYEKLKIHRVYFSAYQRGLGDPNIPGEKCRSVNPDDILMREHRLYQTDYLIRKYGFKRHEIIFDRNGNLMLDKDPKEIWAERNIELYPVRINRADKEMLLRIPGIGPKTVSAIIKYRKYRKIKSLEELGLRPSLIKRAKKYIIFD
ncbi:MAG: helix-hairpin-helix domain-containing protein [Thermodesulfovibrionales bacterium]|nr:helix-hairpin-helix domain-containing protein [Thermodesulfovibrionales bacterium]